MTDSVPPKKSRFKTFKRIIKWSLAMFALLIAGLVAYLWNEPTFPHTAPSIKVEITPEKVSRGKQLVSMLCTDCHQNLQTGSLSGIYIPNDAPELAEVHSANITNDKQFGIGAWSDGEIVYLLRTGVAPNNRQVPPWMPRWNHMSDEDVQSIIAFLRSDDPLVAPVAVSSVPTKRKPLANLLMRVAFKPNPYPTEPIIAPPITDAVAYGKYIVQGKANCYECHSASMSTNNPISPELSKGYMGGGNAMHQTNGQTIYTSNITFDQQTGIGNWTEDQFVKTVRDGIKPDGNPVRTPMYPFHQLQEDEVKAVFAYLKTIPQIHNQIPAPPTDVVSETTNSAGQLAYTKYGCLTCHGPTGVGLGDLRQAKIDFPKDQDLENWIRHPHTYKPATKMPEFGDTISKQDMIPLIAYVRQLGNN